MMFAVTKNSLCGPQALCSTVSKLYSWNVSILDSIFTCTGNASLGFTGCKLVGEHVQEKASPGHNLKAQFK